MLKAIKFPILMCIIVGCISCKFSKCEISNEVFLNTPIESQKYVEELKNQLLKTSNLSYWVEGYKRINGKDLLLISIKGEDLCAEGLLFIQNSPELQDIVYKKAASYRGAEIFGLEYIFKQFNDGNYYMLYKSHESLID